MSSRVFVIGTSMNGVQALCDLVKGLPADFPAPIFIVQHTSPEGPSRLPGILSRSGPLPAAHPRPGELFRPGHIYVAPPDHHMLVRQRYVWLSQGPRENHTRPAVDPLFRSAALAYGPAVVGVVLTGHLDDGTDGLMVVKNAGGLAIVQDPLEASAPSMPASALRHVQGVDYTCKVSEMGALFTALAEDAIPAVSALESRVLLEIENRIAEGTSTLADWQMLERKGRYTGFTCPECHCSLCELPANGILRFRCRAGHAFSTQSLLCSRAEARENQLAGLYGAFLEEFALAERVLAEPTYRQEEPIAADMMRRVATLRRRAAQVRAWSSDVWSDDFTSNDNTVAEDPAVKCALVGGQS